MGKEDAAVEQLEAALKKFPDNLKSAELLAMMHGQAWPQRLQAGPGSFHEVPPFDRDAMMIELDKPLRAQLDGETTMAQRFSIKVRPGALDVLAP